MKFTDLLNMRSALQQALSNAEGLVALRHVYDKDAKSAAVDLYEEDFKKALVDVRTAEVNLFAEQVIQGDGNG